MHELTINGTVFQFNFGIGFMREINKEVSAPVDGFPGVKKNLGLRYAVANIVDGDIDMLEKVLDYANEGQNPRVTKQALDAYIDDETTDIDKLFEDVLNFLKQTNATRKTTNEILEAVEKEKAKQVVQQS